jgi:predicted TIM-barrel fold metal-dependent hydrolase
MKIDIYSHILTEKYLDEVSKRVSSSLAGKKMLETQPTLWNLEERFRMMDRYDGYTQVIMMTGLPIESIVSGQKALDLARLANDEIAQLVSKYPSRFLCGVASVPLGNTDACLKEIDRAINDLKLKGIMIHTPLFFRDEKKQSAERSTGLDSAELMPIYEKMAQFNLPIWIHPNPLWDFKIPDYSSEKEAKYLGWHIFGWPYQDTLAQVRLVFSGILEKYPDLKFINHHAGGMLPFFEKRLTTLCNMMEMRGGASIKHGLSKSPRDYFKKFYNDTAISGSVSALMCAYNFYGAEKMLFGTDMPFDMELGNEAIRETIKSVEQMNITDSEKQAIFEDNAKKLLHFA